MNLSLLNLKTIPVSYTIYYVNTQKTQDLFSHPTLDLDFLAGKNLKNIQLYYRTTGYVGHSGSELIQLRNDVRTKL